MVVSGGRKGKAIERNSFFRITESKTFLLLGRGGDVDLSVTPLNSTIPSPVCLGTKEYWNALNMRPSAHSPLRGVHRIFQGWLGKAIFFRAGSEPIFLAQLLISLAPYLISELHCAAKSR